MKKQLYAISLFTALCLTACGRNNHEEETTTKIPQTGTIVTERPNHPVHDAIDEGKDIVSDVVDDGKNAVNDVADAVDDAVGNRTENTDVHDNYQANDDGKTNEKTRR